VINVLVYNYNITLQLWRINAPGYHEYIVSYKSANFEKVKYFKHFQIFKTRMMTYTHI